MNRIGMQLITERRDEVLNAASKSSRHPLASTSEGEDEKATESDEDLDERTKGRDLLSVLSTFIPLFPHDCLRFDSS